jgi:hypothetical protein
MAWTRRQLDEALTAYERDLVAAGRTRGTVTTCVGDARRFVEWLAGDRDLEARPRTPKSRVAEPGGRTRRAATGSLVPPPAILRKLVDRWKGRGRPAQEAMPWPRDRWEAAFPTHKEVLRALPDELDRSSVRDVCARAVVSERAAQQALLATLAWGYGWVGYGPHRADAMLLAPDAAKRLRAVAKIAASEGAIAAYRSLGHENRVKGLGPAFGTKFIAFCQPETVLPPALIHDELVTAWLEANGRADLRASTWAPRKYEAYLDQVGAWATELRVTAETIEYLIFQDEADRRPGNQWASRADRSRL